MPTPDPMHNPMHPLSVKPGDHVYVYDMGLHSPDRPEDRWDGTVVDVGPTLVWIIHPETHTPQGEAFDRRDGHSTATVRFYRTAASVQASLEAKAAEAQPKTDPADPSSAKPGDEVRVYDINGTPQGWEGLVLSVGPKRVRISYGPSWKTAQYFSRVTGQQQGGTSHVHFKTMAAVEARVRRTTALAVLHVVGLDAAHRGGPEPSLKVLEAAALAVAAYMPEPKDDQP